MNIFFVRHGIANKILGLALFTVTLTASAEDYHVGPGQALDEIGDVPWVSLIAGDRVYIHWRQQAYKEKFVISGQGTAQKPITISGVPGPNGERPVIDGRGAKAVPGLEYSNENRGVIEISGADNRQEYEPKNIVIEGLEIRSGYKNYKFTNSNGDAGSYSDHAASIYVEVVDGFTLRNSMLHDSGNGLFIGAYYGEPSKNILIEKNYIYGNGNVGRYYEHNAYTAAINIIYQYNRFGPLRDGATGNNVKDRSAGLVVRYNWIDGGNRLLDMVEGDDSEQIIAAPSYRQTHVYGNILIERDGGNNQVMHYGGDNGDTDSYRKGKLYFYNNTLYSTRTGTTTLVRLSTNEESADVRNNIFYVTASGSNLALLDENGKLTLRNNWFKPGWVNSHEGGSFTGSVTDNGSSVDESHPGFINESTFDFRLASGSTALNRATALPPSVLPDHDLTMEYLKHQRSKQRQKAGAPDIGAHEKDASDGNSDIPDPAPGTGPDPGKNPDPGSKGDSENGGGSGTVGGFGLLWLFAVMFRRWFLKMDQGSI